MTTSFDPRVRNLIVREARRQGLDPAAVLAVAAGEGGIRYGAVGDGGTSFGPFQLHWQGAMPKKYWGNAAASQAFANSPAGIAYALRQMSKAGASGLRGPAAVETIIRKFERPADPATSVRNALRRYGQFQTMVDSVGGGLPVRGPGGLMVQSDQFRAALASHMNDSIMRVATGEKPDFQSLIGLAQMRKAQIAANEAFGPIAVPPATGRASGSAELIPSKSWAGSHVTDGLGWGTKTAIDIMAKPGTTVGLPVGGAVVRWDPEGAQGGGSMLVVTDDGREIWLGHIMDGAAPGTRFGPGQIIARISPDHEHPHLHIDARRRR